MLYTQQQALSILGLDQSTFVYWMRVLPRVKRLKGRGCHFTPPDLLALGVLRLATNDLGCAIGSIEKHVSAIFELTASASFNELSPKAIVLDANEVQLERLPLVLRSTAARAVIPLGPVIEAIQQSNDLLPLERLMVGR